jgi:putative protease
MGPVEIEEKRGLSMIKPELLAPAGSREALVAAVQNGADAVYLGGRQFNARRGADNFDGAALAQAVEYAHVRGVKVYVTVNILLADTELREAVRFLHTVYNAGADAVIVQDLGLIRLARRVIPELELHASTQMTAHNVPGVLFLKDAGLRRVVLARELALDAVREIKERTGVQVETFVHGALCICYSGQCLMSSMIGGRSGNRGRCAQPCRLEYRLVDDRGVPVADSALVGEYLLSPRDLNLSRHIFELIEAGIDSFKIEGRMRRPEYVATVTRIYRSLIDRAAAGKDSTVSDEEAYELAQIFNRDFTTGYFFDVPGRQMMSCKRPNNRGTRLGRIRRYDRKTRRAQIELEAPLQVGDGIEVWVTRGGRVGAEVNELYVNGRKVESTPAGQVAALKLEGYIHPGDRVFKTHDVKLMEKAVQTFSSSRETRRIPLDFRVRARLGEPLLLEAHDREGVTAGAYTKAAGEPAQKRALTAEFLAGQLDRLGNTPFVLGKLECDLDENVMLPVREINDVRRRVVEQIAAGRAGLRKPDPLPVAVIERKLAAVMNDGIAERVTGSSPLLAVAVSSAKAARAAVQSGAGLVYFGGDVYRRRGKITVSEVRRARQVCREAGTEFYLATPRILHDRELEQYLPYLKTLLEVAPDGVLVAGYGMLPTLRQLTDLPVVTDFPLNVFNRQSAYFLKERGVRRVTLSPELTGEQIKHLAGDAAAATEVIVHGTLPLMVTRYCAVGSLLGGRGDGDGCTAPCRKGSFALLDRKGVVFPVETDSNCLMHIFNSRELCLLETLPYLARAGPAVLRIEARREDDAYVARVTETYRWVLDSIMSKTSKLPDLATVVQELTARGPGYTRGHYYRGVLE